MTHCTCCAGTPAPINHTVGIFTGNNGFAAWDLTLCETCALKLPEKMTEFLGTSPKNIPSKE